MNSRKQPSAVQIARQLATPWGGRTPRAWQAECLPKILAAMASDKRGLVRAATGAGKSIIQSEVIAQRLHQGLAPHERIIVTAPSQKLVSQMVETIGQRCGTTMVGAYYQHAKSLTAPVLVACHASVYGDPCVVCPVCHPKHGADPTARVLDDGDRETARGAWRALAIAAGALEGCLDPFGHDASPVLSIPSGLTRRLIEERLSVVLWLADEAHKTECDGLKSFAFHAAPARRVGFTATPYRSSEWERLSLFDSLLYDYGPSRAIQDGVVMAPQIVSYEGESQSLDTVCLEMIRHQLRQHPGPGVVSADDCADADAYAAKLVAAGIKAKSIHSKQPRDEQKASIAALESGELEVLVHVSMLAEGVDFPWLQWLCLRRSGGTRVRFAQEVGRVIRTAPDKPGCWVLDPHDLFGSVALDYDAMLGEDPEDVCSEVEALAREVSAALEPSIEGGGGERETKERKIRALNLVRSWLRRTSTSLRLKGWADLKVSSTSWRSQPASAKQLAALAGMLKHRAIVSAASTLSPAIRSVLRSACEGAREGELRSGDLSDLLTVLTVLRATGRLPEEVVHAAA